MGAQDCVFVPPTRIDHLFYKFARDKTYEQLLKMEKGKHTHRICDITKRHRSAMSFAVIVTINDISENVYRVGSQSRQGVHYVVRNHVLNVPIMHIDTSASLQT